MAPAPGSWRTTTPLPPLFLLPFFLPWWKSHSTRDGCWLVLLMLPILLLPVGGNKCPPVKENPQCACYHFDDGVFLECPSVSLQALQETLKLVTAPIKSLSVYDLDRNLSVLPGNLFPQDSPSVQHLQISHSGLEDLHESSLTGLRGSLEALTLVNSRLQQVPQKALEGLTRLRSLDLEGNQIHELPSYSFFGLSLVKVNLKSNRLERIAEYAFAGLEESLSELGMTENKLKTFPMTAAIRLANLRFLKLAWNEIDSIPSDGYSKLPSLEYLDLSSNNFVSVPEDTFEAMPQLTTLSLLYNAIGSVDKNAFRSLTELQTIDLSHNKIVFLERSTFLRNKRLRTIDLSHNHIHYINEAFSNLTELRELFLLENNVLSVPNEAFLGSNQLSVIYLQHNAVKIVGAEALASLANLSQIHFSSNYIEHIPPTLFEHNRRLASLSLDGNRLSQLLPGIFRNLLELRELRLQLNFLDSIERGVFAPLPSLLELHLQNNRISHIDSGAFATLRNLQHINLQGNLLTHLGEVFGPSAPNNLLSIQVDWNQLGSVHPDALRGQTGVQIMWLGHNSLLQLNASLLGDLHSVQRLYLTHNELQVVEDGAFENMAALQFLDMSDNRLGTITRYTFRGLVNLEELYLARNALTQVAPAAFDPLARLRTLDLSANMLLSLSEHLFQASLPLQVLSLRQTALQSISPGALQSLVSLRELNLEDNQISAESIPQLKIDALQILSLSGNNLSRLSDDATLALPSLQQLSLEDASLGRIPEGLFARTPLLQVLHLARNQLRNVTPSTLLPLGALRELYLDGNNLRAFPYQALLNTSSLEVLTLSKNRISNVDVSKIYLPKLHTLDLSANRLTRMVDFACCPPALPSIQKLDLSGNRLSRLHQAFFLNTSLSRVNLASNNFVHVPEPLSERNLRALRVLNLTGNPLLSLHEDVPLLPSFPAVLELHITGTNLSILTSKDFEAFPSLLHLFLRANLIARVSPGAFRPLTSLLTLDLGSNEMELLPQERLRGLVQLRLLNLTHNRLKMLEEFPRDLQSLQVLDVSYNQLTKISPDTFRSLASLAELYLADNWIATVASEAFRPLKRLRVLDLSKNYLENLPLNAFRPLEAQIRSLKAEENPLHCGCETRELWEWLHDHRKLESSSGSWEAGRSSGGDSRGSHSKRGQREGGGLRCEHPPELRGEALLELELARFCSSPFIVKLAIQDVRASSVVVSWQGRNHSGLHGYLVAFHALEHNDRVRTKNLPPGARAYRLPELDSDTLYLICVVGLGHWSNWANATNALEPAAILHDSVTSKCAQVRTLQEANKSFLLSRRLGVVVGSAIGVVVFLALAGTLACLKIRHRRQVDNSNKRTATNSIPQETYLSYRHFSIQSSEGAPGVNPSLSTMEFVRRSDDLDAIHSIG